jgi:hypothetical protein
MVTMNILWGVIWLLGALVWLRKAMADEARPSVPGPAQPDPQTEKKRRFQNWVCAVLYVMLGVLYLLKETFERHLFQGH